MPSQGEVLPVFNDLIAALAAQCAACHEAGVNGVGRVWMWGPVPVDPFALERLGEGTDRTGVAQAYALSYDPVRPGTSGDAQALRLQYDYLVKAERALRLRHAGSVRCEMLAAGRRRGLGAATLAVAVLQTVQNVVRQGQT